MGASERYNSRELECIKNDLKKTIRKEAMLWSGVFGTISFMVLSYSFSQLLSSGLLIDEAIASITFTIFYAANVTIESITHYFG